MGRQRSTTTLTSQTADSRSTCIYRRRRFSASDRRIQSLVIMATQLQQQSLTACRHPHSRRLSSVSRYIQPTSRVPDRLLRGGVAYIAKQEQQRIAVGTRKRAYHFRLPVGVRRRSQCAAAAVAAQPPPLAAV